MSRSFVADAPGGEARPGLLDGSQGPCHLFVAYTGHITGRLASQRLQPASAPASHTVLRALLTWRARCTAGPSGTEGAEGRRDAWACNRKLPAEARSAAICRGAASSPQVIISATACAARASSPITSGRLSRRRGVARHVPGPTFARSSHPTRSYCLAFDDVLSNLERLLRGAQETCEVCDGQRNWMAWQRWWGGTRIHDGIYFLLLVSSDRIRHRSSLAPLRCTSARTRGEV